MKVDAKETYHAVLLTPKGNMMGGPDTIKFHEIVKSYIDQGKPNFVVDLGHVDFMNSPGLGVLITAYTSAKNAGGKLIVARPAKKIKQLFVITQIDRIFQHFDEVEEALNSLKPE
jgi:anti-sigma B factor antagonist